MPLSIFVAFDQNKYLSTHEKIVLTILQEYNPRISEILSAKWSNFFPDRFLILEGAKHSANVIVRDKAILERISQLSRHSPELIFPYTTYNRIYNIIARNYSHIFTKIKTKKSRKITHAFRYMNLQGVDNDSIIQDILHHRSNRSGIFYKNKLKGSSHEKKTF